MKFKILLISIILGLMSYSLTSYAISVWLKTIKIPISISSPTSEIEIYKINEDNLIYENLTIINPEIDCDSYYCTISEINIQNSNSIIIFGFKIKNLDDTTKKIYVDMSLYPYLEQSVLYGVGYLTDSCSLTLNEACINIQELKRYPDESMIGTLDPNEERDFVVYLYIPEILESAETNLTFKVTLT